MAVDTVAQVLLSVDRRRLGLPLGRLNEIPPLEAQHYRGLARLSVRLLDAQAVDEAIFEAARIYGIKTWDAWGELDDHKKGFAIWCANAMWTAMRSLLTGRIELLPQEQGEQRRLFTRLYHPRAAEERANLRLVQEVVGHE